MAEAEPVRARLGLCRIQPRSLGFISQTTTTNWLQIPGRVGK